LIQEKHRGKAHGVFCYDVKNAFVKLFFDDEQKKIAFILKNFLQKLRFGV
jgi:hypothetical protein